MYPFPHTYASNVVAEGSCGKRVHPFKLIYKGHYFTFDGFDPPKKLSITVAHVFFVSIDLSPVFLILFNLAERCIELSDVMVGTDNKLKRNYDFSIY